MLKILLHPPLNLDIYHTVGRAIPTPEVPNGVIPFIGKEYIRSFLGTTTTTTLTTLTFNNIHSIFQKNVALGKVCYLSSQLLRAVFGCCLFNVLCFFSEDSPLERPLLRYHRWWPSNASVVADDLSCGSLDHWENPKEVGLEDASLK